MSHLVSYWWFRRTQYITPIGLFYKEVGILWMDVCVEIKMIYKTNIILPL